MGTDNYPVMIKKIFSLIAAALLSTFALLPFSINAAASSTNLIANPSVETPSPANSSLPQYWQEGHWGTNSESFNYLNTGYNSNHSVQVNMTSYSSGDAKWYFNPVSVASGSEYTFSDYYTSNVTTDVVVQYGLSSGGYSYVDLGSVGPSSNWQTFSSTFTTPSGINNLTIFHLINSVGSLTTDNFSLISGAPQLPPPSVGSNLIYNPSVEISSGNLPAGWQEGHWGTNSESFNYLDTGYNSNHSVQVNMTSYSSGDAKWYFNPVSVLPNTNYIFSDYYESNVASDVVVQFEDSSGNYGYLDLGNAPASSSWNNYSATFTTPANTASLTVFHLINRVGSLTTDNYSLSVSTAPSVSITSPSAGSNISGQVALSATASASDGVASVQFKLDGVNLGLPLSSSPYSMNWNSADTTNGTHTLVAVAIGKDGSVSSSAPVIINVSNPDPLGGNLIPNPSINTPDPNNSSLPLDWVHSSWGTNSETFHYLSSGYNDSHSVQVNMTSYSSGDAKWYFTPQLVSQDTQYKYSEYYKSNVQTQIMGVFNMSDGSTQYLFIGLPDSSSAWTHFSTEFSIPLGTVNMTIYHLINSVGSLTTDDFSLTPYSPTGFSRPLLSLTFDDGYSSTFNNGLPLLQQYGYSSTQYIITDLINANSYYMSNAQVLKMYQAGQEIASHTITHSNLTSESTSAVTNELSNSKIQLQKWIGAPVSDMAYPYGLYDNTVMSLAANYYASARGVEDGLNSKDNLNVYDLKVQNVFSFTTTAQIADWVKQAEATNTWLILVYHSVDPSPVDIYNVTPTQLANQLAAIKASGITVENIHSALSEVEAQL